MNNPKASTNQGHLNKLNWLYQSNMIYSHSYSVQLGGAFLWQYWHIQGHICPPIPSSFPAQEDSFQGEPRAKIASDVVQSFCQIGWWGNDMLSKGSMLMKRNLDARRLFLGTRDRLSTAAQMKWDAFS